MEKKSRSQFPHPEKHQNGRWGEGSGGKRGDRAFSKRAGVKSDFVLSIWGERKKKALAGAVVAKPSGESKTGGHIIREAPNQIGDSST